MVEEPAQKTPKHSSSSVSSRKVTFRQPKTNCQPKTRKVPDNHCGLNIGTWNVRTLRTAGNWDILLEEVRRLNLDILGLCETHLTDRESFLNKEEYTVILSSRRDGIAREGVGLLVSEQMSQCLESYEFVSPRMLTVKFKMNEDTPNIIQVYMLLQHTANQRLMLNTLQLYTYR